MSFRQTPFSFHAVSLFLFYEPYAAFGVRIDEKAVFAQGQAAARDVACARFSVKLDRILLPGRIDEAQGFVFCFHDVQRNRGSYRRHRVVQRAGGIEADQGRFVPTAVMVGVSVGTAMTTVMRRS